MKKILALLLFLSIASPAFAADRTVTLAVKGWTCGSCAAASRIALKKLEGVRSVETDLEKSEAVVAFDDEKVTPERMIQAVEKLGYKASVRSAPAAGKPATQLGSAVAGAPVAARAGASSPASPAEAERSIPADRLSLFETPLGCWAVEGLGCGSLSKPVLAELEDDPRIEQAWMNRSGTMIAVVWKQTPAGRSGVETVERIFQAKGLEARALSGAEREKAVQDFSGGSRWYRGAEVDRLSEEEARVVAARLVRRTEKSASLTPEKAASFREEVAKILAHDFVRKAGPEGAGEALMDAARRNLEAKDAEKFREALDQGIAALPGETR